MNPNTSYEYFPFFFNKKIFSTMASFPLITMIMRKVIIVFYLLFCGKVINYVIFKKRVYYHNINIYLFSLMYFSEMQTIRNC